jgi:hypothetical protein
MPSRKESSLSTPERVTPGWDQKRFESSSGSAIPTMRLRSNHSDHFVSTTHPIWYSECAHQFGGTWLDVKDYPPGVEKENAEVGAIIDESGFKLRVKTI